MACGSIAAEGETWMGNRRIVRSAFLAAVVCLFLPGSHRVVSEAAESLLIGPYLGQTPPGKVPKVFAPEIVSTTAAAEWGIAFTPDGWQLYFTRRSQEHPTNDIFYMKAKNEVWSGPFAVPFNTESIDMEPFVTPDGKRLFFSSDRPHDGVTAGRIWGVDIRKSGWSPAWFASGPINDDVSMYLTISKTGKTVYTGPNADLYSAQYESGAFRDPVRLEAPVNSDSEDVHPFIALDDSCIIWDSRRDGVYGGSDLYVAFRTGASSWSKLKNLGPVVNTPDDELCPSITPDRQYLFFSRFVGLLSDIHWVDARVVKSLHPTDMSCSGVKVTPAAPSKREEITLESTVKNGSAVYSMSTSVSFYLDTTRKIGAQSILLGTAGVDSMGPRKIAILKTTSVIPQSIAPGRYYLLASVDKEDWNCDPNRKNNVASRKKEIDIK